MQSARFLVDTNVISHVIRRRGELDAGITRFFNIVDEDRMYLSTVTIGEIQKGIDNIAWPADATEREKRHRLQAELEQKLETLCDRFFQRVIDVDTRVARQWGRFQAEQKREGRPAPFADSLIAACAHSQHLVLATTDGDFTLFGNSITIYNPRTHAISGYHPPYVADDTRIE